MPPSSPFIQTKRVGVFLLPGRKQDMRLFECLSAVYSVQFEIRSGSEVGLLDGGVYLGQVPDDPMPFPVLAYVKEAGFGPVQAATVTFGQQVQVPLAFRGRSVAQRLCWELAQMGTKAKARAIPVASVGGQIIWWASQETPRRVDVTSLQLPVIDGQPSFFEYFNGSNFINLLPLVDFVRRLVGEEEWKPAGLDACFMFDDPNVHSTRYGFLDYRELIKQAKHYNYHVSFATIPLDTWFTNRTSAQLFIEHKDRLSLLVHGNDHLRNELAAFSSNDKAIESLAQALRRVSRFEKRSGVEVSRVMAAPFGACAETTMAIMTRLGFEAASISSGSLRLHNETSDWAANLGLRKTELIAGLPIIPRFKMGEGCQGSILLCAYLNCPIILMGHHQDMADGIGLLAGLSEYINSFVGVRWSDMKSISRSNYLLKQSGDNLFVRPYSRVFDVAVPSGITKLIVETPVGGLLENHITVTALQTREILYSGLPSEPIHVGRPGDLRVTFKIIDRIDPVDVSNAGFNFWAFGRRQLTEGRDRFQAVIARGKRDLKTERQ